MSVSSTNSARGKKSATESASSAADASTTSSPTKRYKSQADDDGAMEPNHKAPRTPPKTTITGAKIVTPASTAKLAVERPSNARRTLGVVDEEKGADYPVVAKKKLPFGATKEPIAIPPNVQSVYSIIQKYTGSIGGNGNGGGIYGELTAGSMQKMINLMVEHTGLSNDSRFIDVGCGLAKPSLHVAQYPGVEFSYGIEVEHVRYMLGMSNLEQVLKAALKEEAHRVEVSTKKEEVEGSKIGHKCILSYGDITEAKSFDPFTHVYMFDVGMPPRLFHKMSEMFNKSQAAYLICYHGPKTMIDDYGFNIELVTQTPTYMTASTECHEGYIYRHVGIKPIKGSNARNLTFGTPCDPRFSDAWKICRTGVYKLLEYVSGEVQKEWGESSKRVTRSASRARDSR